MTADRLAADAERIDNAEARQHTEHGLERKQQLLDAAGELFAARGYSATRIADICQAAGVAKGLFYWYFPTKGELFAELSARCDSASAGPKAPPWSPAPTQSR